MMLTLLLRSLQPNGRNTCNNDCKLSSLRDMQCQPLGALSTCYLWGTRGSFMEEEIFEVTLKKVNFSNFKYFQTKSFDFFFFYKNKLQSTQSKEITEKRTFFFFFPPLFSYSSYAFILALHSLYCVKFLLMIF